MFMPDVTGLQHLPAGVPIALHKVLSIYLRRIFGPDDYDGGGLVIRTHHVRQKNDILSIFYQAY